MEEAIWTLAKGEMLFDGTLNIILGGPHSGRSKLLEIANNKLLSNYKKYRRLPLLITIPPYVMQIDQMQAKLAHSIVCALGSCLPNIPLQEDRKMLIHSFKSELLKQGYPKSLEWLAHDPIMPVVPNKDLHLSPDLEPLNWVFDVMTSVASSNDVKVQILVDEFSRLPVACQQNLFHLSRTCGTLLAISTRSLVATEYDHDNPLYTYLPAANYLVLDFEPNIPEFQESCKLLLQRRLIKQRGTEEIHLIEEMLHPQSRMFPIAVSLSNGHIGRFIDFLRNFASQYKRGKIFSRSSLEDFCRIGFDEIIQYEPEHDLVRRMRNIVYNLHFIDHEIAKDIYSTTLNLQDLLSVGTFDPSVIRSGVLSWLFHVNGSDRISVATDTRHIPMRIRISSIAAMLGGIALSKIY